MPGTLPHIIRPIMLSPNLPFNIPYIVHDLAPPTKAHRVAQQRVQRTKTANETNTPRRSNRLTPPPNRHIRFRNALVISQEAINLLLLDDLDNDTMPFTPLKLLPIKAPLKMNFKHYAMPMVHPVTGETISSYKKLMKDLVTAKTWQTALVKISAECAREITKRAQLAPTPCW